TLVRFLYVAAIAYTSLSAVCVAPAVAQSPTPSPSPTAEASNQQTHDPVEGSDDRKNKLTFGVYFTPGQQFYDLNMRHQFGPVTAWIAGFYAPGETKLLRTGIQYDYKKKWFHFVPTIEVATTKAVSGSLYTEWGGNTILIAGVSRTNLKAFFDLFWDPS